MTEEIIKVENLYKIFGLSPEKALKLLEQDMDKDEIFKKTGITVGVQDANFTLNTGDFPVDQTSSPAAGLKPSSSQLRNLLPITSEVLLMATKASGSVWNNISLSLPSSRIFITV